MFKRAFLLILLLVLCGAPGGAFAQIGLRVVARDDSPEAQAEKMQVRDKIFPLLPREERMLPLAWPLLQKAARAEKDCRLSLRFYTPPGERTPRLTVQITIGRGEGKNWFGVLFREALFFCGEKTEKETLVCYFPLLSLLFSVFTGAPAAPVRWSGG